MLENLPDLEKRINVPRLRPEQRKKGRWLYSMPVV